MSDITLEVTGINDLLKKYDKLSKTIQKEVKDAVNESALKIQSDAKKAAPVNLGSLRQSIYLKESVAPDAFVYTVGVAASYAPYVEFGTGGKVKIEPGYENYAQSFKGRKGGSFKEMVMALAEWVAKKGIVGTYSIKTQRRTGGKSTQSKQNLSAAYAIAISILKKGLRPQAFLIPAFEQEKKNLINKIENIFKHAKP
jgi:HK97 gp10 family phage protein